MPLETSADRNDAHGEAGEDVDLPDALGTPLQAELTDNAPIGLLLLKHGAAIEAASGGYELRVLQAAASYGHPALAAPLLDHGADPSLPDKNDMTAIMPAAANGHTEAVNVLRRHGVDVRPHPHRSWPVSRQPNPG